VSKSGPMPDLQNLGWAPFAATDNVEIYDRWNGVPTLGVVRKGSEHVLFWQAAGADGVGIWVYVNLDAADLARLDDDEQGPLDGIVMGLQQPRFATIGVSNGDLRLWFEREWQIPTGLTVDNSYHAIVEYTLEVLTESLAHDLPPTRREITQHASDVVRQLVNC
jgi:hypothetical protein